MPKGVPKIVTVCEVCSIAFERTPAFHRSAEAKGGKVRFCSQKCFGIAKSAGKVVVTPYKPKQDFTCDACGSVFQRWPSAIRFAEKHDIGIRFCSKECHGRARTTGILELPARSDESKQRSSDAMRKTWGRTPHPDTVMKLPKQRRAYIARGTNFTPAQKRAWIDSCCARCGATESLELDHIICVAAGGESVRENAQTLCRPCNRWKKDHVDLPLARKQTPSGG